MVYRSGRKTSASSLKVSVPLDLTQFNFTLRPKRKSCKRQLIARQQPRDPCTGRFIKSCDTVDSQVDYLPSRGIGGVSKSTHTEPERSKGLFLDDECLPYHPLPITCQPPPAACLQPPVTCQQPPVTCQPPSITCQAHASPCCHRCISTINCCGEPVSSYVCCSTDKLSCYCEHPCDCVEQDVSSCSQISTNEAEVNSMTESSYTDRAGEVLDWLQKHPVFVIPCSFTLMSMFFYLVTMMNSSTYSSTFTLSIPGLDWLSSL